MPAAELMLMIDPPLPASIIGGTTALMVFHTPVRLMSMTSCHCWAEISHSRPQFSTPALATTMSRRPNCSIASDDHPLLSGEVADVDLVGEDLAPLALDQVHRLGEVLGQRGRIAVVLGDRPAGVDRDDVGAGAGQPDAVRAALSARGARHVGDLACQWFVFSHGRHRARGGRCRASGRSRSWRR